MLFVFIYFMAASTTETKIQCDIPQITLKEAENAIKLFIEVKRPVFLWGPVGVGKSDLIKKIAKEQKRGVIDIRLSQMDSTDLRGIPYFHTTNQNMEWAPPSMFPIDSNDNSIIFFDELNCAQPSIQAVAYQLILDRRVGNYILPDNVSVVAAGNRESDRGVTFRMPSPLLNRFVHLEIKPDLKCWLT